MRSFWTFIILLGLSLIWITGDGTTRPPASSLVPDVSWPNCGLNLPKADIGIVGVTGGLALKPNPCLAHEAGLFKNLSVYVNTGYPGITKAAKFSDYPKLCSLKNEQCLAYNYGYNSGLYDIKYALLNGVVADRWWLDVETENSWSDSTKVNRAVLQGTLNMLSNFAGKDRVGFYSYPGQWNLITGNWRNKYPTWVATGNTEKARAQSACSSSSFTGGPVLLGQYTPNLDQNYICH